MNKNKENFPGERFLVFLSETFSGPEAQRYHEDLPEESESQEVGIDDLRENLEEDLSVLREEAEALKREVSAQLSQEDLSNEGREGFENLKESLDDILDEIDNLSTQQQFSQEDLRMIETFLGIATSRSDRYKEDVESANIEEQTDEAVKQFREIFFTGVSLRGAESLSPFITMPSSEIFDIRAYRELNFDRARNVIRGHVEDLVRDGYSFVGVSEDTFQLLWEKDGESKSTINPFFLQDDVRQALTDSGREKLDTLVAVQKADEYFAGNISPIISEHRPNLGEADIKESDFFEEINELLAYLFKTDQEFSLKRTEKGFSLELSDPSAFSSNLDFNFDEYDSNLNFIDPNDPSHEPETLVIRLRGGPLSDEERRELEAIEEATEDIKRQTAEDVKRRQEEASRNWEERQRVFEREFPGIMNQMDDFQESYQNFWSNKEKGTDSDKLMELRSNIIDRGCEILDQVGGAVEDLRGYSADAIALMRQIGRGEGYDMEEMESSHYERLEGLQNLYLDENIDERTRAGIEILSRIFGSILASPSSPVFYTD